LDGNGNKDTWVAAHYQKDVDVDLHTPVSIGIGTTFKIYQTNIYFSAEWFSGIKKFEVIPTAYFRSQVGGDTIKNGVTHDLRSVLNIGVGIQHSFNDNLSLNGSFTTDYSAKDPASDTNLAITSWDIYHFLIGTSFKIKRSEFTLGLGFSYAKDRLDLRDWSLNDLRNSLTENNLERIDFIYRNYKFILGFSI
jgi:long-subunit fatty acid transport protein